MEARCRGPSLTPFPLPFPVTYSVPLVLPNPSLVFFSSSRIRWALLLRETDNRSPSLSSLHLYLYLSPPYTPTRLTLSLFLPPYVSFCRPGSIFLCLSSMCPSVYLLSATSTSIVREYSFKEHTSSALLSGTRTMRIRPPKKKQTGLSFLFFSSSAFPFWIFLFDSSPSAPHCPLKSPYLSAPRMKQECSFVLVLISSPPLVFLEEGKDKPR